MTDCGCPLRRCLVCGAKEPCLTEADLKPGDAGIPCTFDLTYPELVALLHQKDDQIRALEADRRRLDWLSLPENYDVEFILSQAGYRIQQPQRIPGTDRFEEVLLTSRDWPTLRDALDEAMERGTT